MIISNETFTRFFSADKINQLITNRPVREFTEDFKVLMQKRPQDHGKTYSAIFIKQGDLQMVEKNLASQESIDTLVSTQQNTEKFLAPAMSINLKERFKRIFSSLSGIFSRKKKAKRHGC